MHHIDPYYLTFLPTEVSCKLLHQKVFQQDVYPPELQDVSLEIAEKCKGLPLLSYNNFPDYLKPCLLYMGMFPEDARILVSKSISLWIAEDFVQNIESGRLLEEADEGYLIDLIHELRMKNNMDNLSKTKESEQRQFMRRTVDLAMNRRPKVEVKGYGQSAMKQAMDHRLCDEPSV
ncbi:hypothetical protein BC332_07533 [Capsicum chinense]|nr:hypothetical protein BC332_07533 [Capsicum chinense]